MGCGDGVLTAELQRKCHRVVGIDFAPDMVKAAMERASSICDTWLNYLMVSAVRVKINVF